MFKRPSRACGQYVSMFTSMFLALHHSAHAYIHVFVARAVFLEAAVSFISKISLSETRGKRAWSTAIVSLFCWKSEDFHRRIYCTVVLHAGGCSPPFVVAEG